MADWIPNPKILWVTWLSCQSLNSCEGYSVRLKYLCFVFAYVCKHVPVCVCVYMYVKAMNWLPQSLFPLFFLYIFSSLSLELTNWLEWLTSVLCLSPSTPIRVTDVSLSFYVDVGDPNRGSRCVLLVHRLRPLLAAFSGVKWENDCPGWV